MAPPARVPVEKLLGAIRGGKYPWWYPEKAKGLDTDYFVYPFDFEPLTASQTLTEPINTEGDSAFCILSAVAVETDTTNLVFLPNRPVLMELFSTGSGRNLSSGPVHIDNWFGTAEEPKYWDLPKFLMPNSTFNVRAQNLEATDRNLRGAFHGFKIFGYQP